jgi:hypothetical protein
MRGIMIMENLFNFGRQLCETAESAGIKIYSDDKCCRILAWLFTCGGENEQVINSSITMPIFYAQKRLNLLGGEKPNDELLHLLHKYIKSITDYDNPPEWVIELEKEYQIKTHRSKLRSGK